MGTDHLIKKSESPPTEIEISDQELSKVLFDDFRSWRTARGRLDSVLNTENSIDLSENLESAKLSNSPSLPTVTAEVSDPDEDRDDEPLLMNTTEDRRLLMDKKNREAVIMKLLEATSDQGKLDDEGQTALHLAAQTDQTLTKRVLDSGFDIDKRNLENETPLVSAIVAGKVETVNLLLKHRADVNTVGAHGKTPLHYAAMYNDDTLIMEALLRKEPFIDAPADSNQTPLFTAARRGHLEICRLLLKEGAEAHADKEGKLTALHYLAMRDTPACRESILSVYGPYIEIFYDPSRDGLTSPPNPAKPSLVPLFLAAGADINAKGEGHTALDIAILTGEHDLVSSLLSHHAVAKYMDLTRAMQYLGSRNLSLILDRGADIEARDSDYKKTPLMCASESGSVEAVKILLEHGARVESRDYVGHTALSYAASNARLDVVSLLLQHDSDPNLEDYNWTSPLIAAASGKSLCGKHYETSIADREKVVELLLGKGANVDAKDASGGKAVMYAVQNGHLGVLKLLVEKGGADWKEKWKGVGLLEMAKKGKKVGKDQVEYLMIKRYVDSKETR